MLARPLFAALTLWSATIVAAEQWPQFRGPTGDGHVDAPGLPVKFSDSENVTWKTPIHGKGWSSPVIWGDRVWITTANEQGTELSAVCLDKNGGKVLVDKIIFRVSEPQFSHKFNSYASPTPVIEEGRVYVNFGSAGTACLDSKTGDVLWERRDFVCNHYRGSGSSPILWKDLLILHFDGTDEQYVVAVNKKSGETVWRTNRSIDFQDLNAEGKPSAEGDGRKAYATPHVTTIGGKPVLLSSGAKAHYAYEPETGKELWRIEERAQHSASTRPVVGHGLAFFPTGFARGQLLAVKLPATVQPGEKPQVLSEADLAWRMKRGVPNKPSLLLVGDLLFLMHDGGVMSCVEAKTGEEIWRERVHGNYSASPIFANGRIYVCSEEGKVAVVAAEREFKLLAENFLPDGFMASPAVSGNSLFLRTRTHLYRIDQ